MSLPSLWSWLQITTNLQINGQVPKVTGFINLRGQVVYARLIYNTGVIRVIAKCGNSNLEVRVASESGDFLDVGLESLRSEVKRLLEVHLLIVGNRPIAADTEFVKID